ncbi:MAG TPA: cytochrome c3 family protein [Thermoguttaceae bacterium]|nr:cytochrome c3 family protein [Thermoguttaceae bacterium]
MGAEADPKDGAAASGAEKAEEAQKPEKAENGSGAPSEESEEPPQIDPLSVNAACYVCHMTFVGEEMSAVHLKEKTTCIDCHGLSAPHANDENIGATPPDIVFKRADVDASCEECHEEHDAPATKVVARFLERKLSESSPICTDCHGTHKIEQPEEADEDDQGEVTLGQPQPTTQKPATLTSK